MNKKNCIIGKVYKIRVNIIICGEWLNETTFLNATYKGNDNFMDDDGHNYNSSVISVKEI